MERIAVIGLGAMGSRMAMNLIKAGFNVIVWNRTPDATIPLVAAGAKRAVTPREAAHGVAYVMAMVRDVDASRQVWLDPETGALAGMAPNAIAIESSTLLPGWIRELGEAASQRSISLLEAPVSGTLPQAEAGQLIYMVGGEERILRQATPVLKAMGNAIRYIGPLGTGTSVKLATNALLGIQVVALAELIAMMKRSGVDVRRAIDAISATPVWSTVAGRAASSMLLGNFTPQFPIELIEKDFRYLVEEAGSTDAAPTIEVARRTFHEAIEAGFGRDNMTSVLRLFSMSKATSSDDL